MTTPAANTKQIDLPFPPAIAQLMKILPEFTMPDGTTLKNRKDYRVNLKTNRVRAMTPKARTVLGIHVSLHGE